MLVPAKPCRVGGAELASPPAAPVHVSALQPACPCNNADTTARQVEQGQHPNLQHLYRAIATGQRQLLRFRAAWTNGGVDEDLPSYSMDNMLTPTRLNSHSTALGRNVDVNGFLLVSLEASGLP